MFEIILILSSWKSICMIHAYFVNKLLIKITTKLRGMTPATLTAGDVRLNGIDPVD